MEILDQRRPPAALLSPLFHYYVSRSNPDSLVLLDFRSGLQTAVTDGVCRARFHAPAFDDDGARERPSDDAFRDAQRQQLVGFDPATRRMQYEVMDNRELVDSCRASIASGYPVLLGFWMTSAYWDLSRGQPVHGPPPPEPSSDGHAVTAVGYDDGKRALRIKDSRGKGFAQDGGWWLPYSVLETTLVHEAWVLRKITYDG